MEKLSQEGLVTYWTRVSPITHLYSETDSDPVIMAKLDAPELAVDNLGRKLPYEIEVIPRPINKVETRILVFKDERSHSKYLCGF